MVLLFKESVFLSEKNKTNCNRMTDKKTLCLMGKYEI